MYKVEIEILGTWMGWKICQDHMEAMGEVLRLMIRGHKGEWRIEPFKPE